MNLIRYNGLRRITCMLGVLAVTATTMACSSGDGDDGEPITIDDLPPVVFISDKNERATDELFINPLENGANITTLSGVFTSGSVVQSFKLSPDNQKIAFLSDRETPNLFDLWVSDLDGSNLENLSNLPGGRQVMSFDWSPDSKLLAYIANQDDQNIFELFKVPADGGSNPSKLSGTLTAGRNVTDFAWSPTFNINLPVRIVYRANQRLIDNFELFSSLSDGSEIGDTPISGSNPANGSVTQAPPFRFSPDGSLVAFVADILTDDTFELFTVEPDGGLRNRVSTINMGLGREVQEYKWAPDSQFIAYTSNAINLASVFSLYTTQRRNSTPSPLVELTDGQSIRQFDWESNESDSQLLAFIANTLPPNNFFELFTVSRNIILSVTPVSSNFINSQEVLSFEWTPDSQRLAYLARKDTTVSELYVTGPSVRSDVKISGELEAGASVRDFKWSPDSGLVAYRADQETVGTIELFTTRPVLGSAKTKVSGDLTPGGNVTDDFKWSPDSLGIGYLADQDTFGRLELFVSLSDGNNDNTKVSGDMVSGSIGLQSFDWVEE